MNKKSNYVKGRYDSLSLSLSLSALLSLVQNVIFNGPRELDCKSKALHTGWYKNKLRFRLSHSTRALV